MIYRMDFTGKKNGGQWIGPTPFTWKESVGRYIVLKDDVTVAEAENSSIKLIEINDEDKEWLTLRGLENLDKPVTQPSPTE